MKIFKNILMLMLAVSVMFTLVACSGDADNKTEETTNETTEAVTTVAEETTAAPADDKVTYTVTVVNENNEPISGAMVQMCLEACIPGLTDAEGVATFSLEEADYKVSFVTVPEGYACDQDAFYFADGSYEMTITLTAAE